MTLIGKGGKSNRFTATKVLRLKDYKRVIFQCENPPKATPALVKLMARVKASKSSVA